MRDSDIQLEALLRTMPVVAPATNLAERIIAATKPVVAAVRPASSSIWEALSELLLPKPAFALACALMMGVAVGVQVTTNDAAPDANSYDNFLSYEGDVL